jgi:hypothetical protein
LLHRIQPQRLGSLPFMRRIERLDELTYGAAGLAIPRWVLYDCASVPGAIYGFAVPAARLPEALRRVIDVPSGETGLVPVSMLLAVPMVLGGSWHTYGLCSLNEAVRGALPAALRRWTLGGGLGLLDARTVYGSAPWQSTRLSVYARFAPLEVLAAWMPVHTEPASATFRFEMSADRLLQGVSPPDRALGQDDPDVRWLDGSDAGELRSLQAALEAGRRLEIVASPVIDGAHVLLPLREMAG